MQSLSETLQLDHLWNTLSDCLVELEENADHHAVLVLQPAVEAFFLVHASNQSNSTKSSNIQNESDIRLLNPVSNISSADNVETNANSPENPNEQDEAMQIDESTNNVENPSIADERSEMAPVSPISLFDR